jgi:NAD(P)-dependent dehydrogenase (short-subunit alcohol dehydrogenase family)
MTEARIAPSPVAFAKVVLITGASSGIGEMCARRLAASGWRAFAAARGTPEPLDPTVGPLDPAVEGLQMDVDDDESVRAGIAKILEKTGRLDAVVNNAGYALLGAVEDTEMSQAKAVFETNFFGALRVCQAALPALRASGGGHIVNISSLGGFVGLPFGGLYSASKFALEGLSESLRLEARAFGVHVVIVEPGDFRTQIMASRRLAAGTESGVYAAAFAKFLEGRIKEEASAPTPEPVVALIERILTDRRPKTRYSVGKFAQRLVIPLKRFLPSQIFEALFRFFVGV